MEIYSLGVGDKNIRRNFAHKIQLKVMKVFYLLTNLLTEIRVLPIIKIDFRTTFNPLLFR